MTALIIDTSTEHALLALTQNIELLEINLFPKGTVLTKSLPPALQKLLQDGQLSVKDLSFIAVGIGPGSYTGTRVGVSLAKSIAYALDITLIGFNSLLAFSPKDEGPFACVMPTARGDLYLLKGDKNSKKIFNHQACGLIPPNTFADLLEKKDRIISSDPSALARILSPYLALEESSISLSAINIDPLIPLVYEEFEIKKEGQKQELDLIYLQPHL